MCLLDGPPLLVDEQLCWLRHLQTLRALCNLHLSTVDLRRSDYANEVLHDER